MSTMIFRPILNGPRARLARVVKRSKPTYCIKTKRTLLKWESFKARFRKSGCLLKDLLQVGRSRISSPPTGHPTIYGKFIMDKYIKTEICKRDIYQ